MKDETLLPSSVLHKGVLKFGLVPVNINMWQVIDNKGIALRKGIAAKCVWTCWCHVSPLQRLLGKANGV